MRRRVTAVHHIVIVIIFVIAIVVDIVIVTAIIIVIVIPVVVGVVIGDVVQGPRFFSGAYERQNRGACLPTKCILCYTAIFVNNDLYYYEGLKNISMRGPFCQN